MPKNHKGSKTSKGSSKRSAKVAPITMPLEPLKSCHRIAPKERLFLEAAERGDKHTMIKCLHPPSPVNVNCTNMIGRSAIQIAVDNENVEIVELLLKEDGVKIGDALLYAIREGVFKIVEMLIDHPSITPEMLGIEWTKSKYVGEIGDPEESSDYSPDISPVILAAHCNQFEILQLLLMRGALIDRPHQLSCSCRRCQEKVHEDGLRHSLKRINTYRALASPAWISLTSPDPILTAFRLSWELERLALRENEFKDTYIELSNQCQKCACDLLDQCRSSEEVIAVLNKESDAESGDDLDDGDDEKLTLARLKLAIKYEQKEFVAHPNSQQLLTSIWYEGLPSWRKRNFLIKFIMCIGLILLLPFMAMYYWVFPHSRIGQLLRSPFMKFLYHSASYGVFLILLMCSSIELSGIEGREKTRGPPPTELEWFVCIWVMGFVWAECKQLWEEGLKAYIRQWWNWLDFIMLSLYLTCFTLRLVAFFQIESGKYGPRYMLRENWPVLDPTIVSEGLFAVAVVFSFARIIFLFQVDQYLGPLQISLGCMLIDIAKFLFIFFLVLTSFACGLNQLYWYYNPTETPGNPSSFFTLENSYRTLYWSLFSLTRLQDIKIAGGQSFTETVGEMLFMAYHAMAIIVLLNMLIAMMSNSFQEIENHADMEWKFTRSKLWMGYFDQGSTLPPPFNLIISPKSIVYVFQAVKDLCARFCPRKRSIRRRQKSFDGNIKTKTSSSFINNLNGLSARRPTINGDARFVNKGKQSEKATYQNIMRRLVTRYIHQMKKQRRQDGVNEDDLLEIKQDISSLRYEIRDDRKKDSLQFQNMIETLRNDILGSIWERSMTIPRPRPMYPSNYTPDRAKVQDEPPAYNSFLSGYRADVRNSEHEGHDNRDKTPRPDLYSAQNGNKFVSITDTARNITTTKVESYLSHLGDSYSSQTSDNFPAHNLGDSLQSREYIPQSNTSYGYNLYARGAPESKSKLLPCDIEHIKLEIMSSLKTELQDTAKDLATDMLNYSNNAAMLPSINSELYQTHLYTQL